MLIAEHHLCRRQIGLLQLTTVPADNRALQFLFAVQEAHAAKIIDGKSKSLSIRQEYRP